MAKKAKKIDYMALTPAERKMLVRVMERIDEALTADTGAGAAYLLQNAEEDLRHIQHRQWWSTQ